MIYPADMDSVAEKKALLDWYVAAGIDETITEEPVNRFAVVPAAAPVENTGVVREAQTAFKAPGDAPPVPLRPAPKAPQLQSRDAAVQTAQEVAAGCATLEELRAAFEAFVGEAPGAEEDRQGLPFVGPAGRLLDKILVAIELDRTQVYITNILPWRPPGNRNPTDAEISACLPFLERHITLASPKILLFVGGTAAKTLLRRTEGIMRLRGKWTTYEPASGDPITARAMLHPAYLIHQPAQKRETWNDLLDVKARLDALPQSSS